MKRVGVVFLWIAYILSVLIFFPPSSYAGYCGDGICDAAAGENMNNCVKDCSCMNVTGGNGNPGVCTCNFIAQCFSCCVDPGFGSCSAGNCSLWVTPQPPVSAPPVSPSGPPIVSPPGALAPVITSPASLNVTANVPFSFQITASNSPTSFGAANLPSGVTVDTVAGIIKGVLATPISLPSTVSASNSAGSGMGSLIFNVSGPCGAGIICGHIMSHENSGDVPNMNVQLKRYSTGKVEQITATNTSGDYSFTVADAEVYYVIPAINRGENISPSGIAAVATSRADFVARGLKSTINISGEAPGTFLVFSTFTFTAPTVKTIRAGMPSHLYTTVVGPDGKAHSQVDPGEMMYLTCWVPHDGFEVSPFTKRHSVRVDPNPLIPQANYTSACGALP